MIKKLLRRLGVRNNFDPSISRSLSSGDLVKILEGRVDDSNSRDSVYFIVCRKGLELLQDDGAIEVQDLPNVVDDVFNRSKWFGKFEVEGRSQIIVPFRYLVDNGGMIAYTGWLMLNGGAKFTKVDDVDIRPRERTDQVEVCWR